MGSRRPNGSPKNSHSEARHFPIQLLGEDGVPVVDHEAIGMIAWNRLAALLRDPFRRRMSDHAGAEGFGGFPLP